MGVTLTLRAVALTLPALVTLVAIAAAQDASQEVNVIELPPGLVLPPGVNPAAPAADAANASAAAKSPEEKRLAELLKLKFDRSAASILQAQRTIADGKPAENPDEQFRLNVVAGRWADVGAFLKSLPPADAAKLYDYLLKDLDRAPTTGSNQNQQVAGPTPSPTLLLDDIPALADIAPASLGEEQIKLLGALLTRVLAPSNFIDTLIERLEIGTEKLGGKESEKRDLAAQLLLNANRPAEALKFLPPLESGKETASLPGLDRYVRCIFSLGRQEQKDDSIQRSWELNQMILSAADCPADLREKAWRRSGDIARFLPASGTAAWTKAPFLQDPKRLVNMLDAIAAQIAADRTSRDTSLRIKNLTMQRQIVDALLPAADQRTQWQPALNLFATNWMEEADYARRLHQPPRNPNMVQYDDFGNRIYMGNQQYPQQSGNPNQLPPIAIADILTTAPHNEWIAAVDASLVPRTLTLLAELHLKLEQDAKALPWLEKLAPLHPKEAQRLANEILRVWASTHDPRRGVPQRSSNIVYYNMYGMMQQQQGIPLTRALQQRNLEELSALLSRLRKLPIPPLDDSAIVSAFTTAHSQAEVFREESIALVLGNPDSIRAETLSELLQTMRQRLATQWRKPAVQQQAKTQRTDTQIDAEVLRGYELLGSLIDKGLSRDSDSWRLNLVNAATLFDWAEFQYGKKVDLAIYVDKRERSFAAFQRAADLYAGQLSKIEEKDETPLLYQQWLNANLGASDLALLTRQQEPAANQIERIRSTIAALPGGAAERHFNALAKAVGSSDSLPPHLKPVYMRTALSIVGDRPDAVEIRKLVEYYDGLLKEIEFSVRIDGDTTVGHGQPFGVFCTVRHTADLERENAGGFSKYLRNQSQSPYYYNPYGIAPIDHRDELEKQIREKLGEGFEVVSITFHDEKVQARGYGRAGWRETPIAYLLLKAKDPSVDRLPTLRLDVDFIDPRGPVSLPVESVVTLLDARPDAAPSRPVTEIEVTQTLDDRELKAGKLTVEVKATAKGLLPDFRSFFDFTPAGLKLDDIEDGGAAVARFSSEGENLAPASERNWLIKLTAEPGSEGTRSFKFPAPKSTDLKVHYKRYQDADLVEVSPDLALAGLPLSSAPLWRWIALGTGGVAALGFFTFRMRQRSTAVAAKPAYTLPAVVTPFTTLQLLRDLANDQRLAFTIEQREKLSQLVRDIEAFYFSREHDAATAPNLDSIARDWIGQAQALAA